MSYPSSRERSWWAYLATSCFIALLWLVVPPTASGQQPPSDSLQSIETALEDSLLASTLLRQALTLQRDQRLALELSYAELKARLQTSAASLQTEIERLETSLADSTQLSEDLQAEISRLTGLLTASREESEALLRAYRLYEAEMSSQVARLEATRDWWRLGAFGAGIVAVLALVAFFVR